MVVDPFTMRSRRRSLSSLLDGTTHATPEAEEAYLKEILAGATHLRPVVLDRSTPLGRAQAMMYEASTVWSWSSALWHYRKDGGNRRTNASLRTALGINPWVSDYLLGAFSLPRVLPEPISPGSDEEAIVYVWSALAGWLRTLGAIEWLRGQSEKP